MPKVYLAGPDVFFPDAMNRAERLKAQCQEVGFTGVFPLDANLDLSWVPKGLQGYRIYEANIGLIRDCDAVLANMSPFRGASMDVGTAFEMGYGRALGKPVVGYTESRTEYRTRAVPDGLLVEDFGMVDNLMVHACTEDRIFSTVEQALRELAKVLSLASPEG